jgi:hypothetical protein
MVVATVKARSEGGECVEVRAREGALDGLVAPRAPAVVTGPVYLTTGMLMANAVHQDVDQSTDAMRTGRGVAWGEHHHHLFSGVERFFRPGYQANLVAGWIPALSGVEAKLRSGAAVADVGCGHGCSSIVLAQAFASARITGFDSHPPSIHAARKAAVEAGVADRVTFEVAAAQDFPVPATTWCASSTRCTTWATRSVRPPTSAGRWRPTVPGCWSSPRPANPSRTTSTRSGGCSTRRPR